MNRPKAWYAYHPADIEADTADLTLEEFGAYQKLLNFHFLQDSIPADTKRMALILSISETKTKRIWSVLQRFFYKENGRYYQRRMVREIEKSVEKSKVRSEAARARWDAQAEANADANACADADTTTTTATKVKEKTPSSEPKVPPCPHLEIISAYHETLPERPSVMPARWKGSASERNLQARWRENEEHRSVDWWRGYFSAVRTNDWWMNGKDDGWKGVDLHWLVKRANFDKVVQHWANLS